MLRKIGIRILILVLILTGLNFIYNITFYEKDLKENCEECEDTKRLQPGTDIFYYGESSNVTAAENDSIKTSIADITNLFFPTLRVTTINKSAVHGGIYRYWLNCIDLKKEKPKAIIVTMNLRSFDAAWIHSRLETPLQQKVVMVRPYPNLVNRFALSLQAFDNKTEQQREEEMLRDWKRTKLHFPFDFKYKTVRQWDNAMANKGHLKPDGTLDNEKTILACHYIKTYAFNVTKENPRVKDFDCIADWCYKNNVNLYFNLLAENVNYADSLVGKELVFLMRENRDFLVKRYSKNNCTVVDNLEAVDGKQFIDQSWTTEHYTDKGRMKIGKNLAQRLKTQFKNNYTEAY